MKFLFLLPLFAALLVAGCGEKSAIPSEAPKSLSDAEFEKLLKAAFDYESLITRNDGLMYRKSKPYSGWAKAMSDSGQVHALMEIKDGKHDGLVTYWWGNGLKREEITFKDGKQDGLATYYYDNGQKREETTFKDGRQNGIVTYWHDNGQKKAEVTYQDDKQISGKYWNSKGEEVETVEEVHD